MAGEMWQLEKTAIGQAILQGDPGQLAAALADHTPLGSKFSNFLDRKGNSYLHLACKHGNCYVLHHLTDAGIDLDLTNVHGNTALHVTAIHRRPGHVSHLLMAGCDTTLRNKAGYTAAELASDSLPWLEAYKVHEPGLRQCMKSHDMTRLKELFALWPTLNAVATGKNCRQYAASLTFHDIVVLIDSVKFSNMMTTSVLLGDHNNLEYSLTRTSGQLAVNQLRQTPRRRHILQEAIALKDLTSVKMLISAGAGVNTILEVNGYFKAPLYFDVIRKDLQMEHSITKLIVAAADFSLKDERGRTALAYVVDIGPMGQCLHLIRYILNHGVDISSRDETFHTARDIALLTRQHDVIKLIDEVLINAIRNSDMNLLKKWFINGYPHFIIEYESRDSWVYAAGNCTNEVNSFLELLPWIQSSIVMLNKIIKDGSTEDLEEFIDGHSHPELLKCKDMTGRCCLLSAIQSENVEAVTVLLSREPLLQCLDRASDFMGRNAMCYAESTGSNVIVDMVKQAYFEIGQEKDQIKNVNIVAKKSIFLDTSKKENSVKKRIHVMIIYERLLANIKEEKSSLKQFRIHMKLLNCPVADIPKILEIGHNGLVRGYESLLLTAVVKGRRQICEKLLKCGVDHTRVDPVILDGEEVHLNTIQLENITGNYFVSEFLKC